MILIGLYICASMSLIGIYIGASMSLIGLNFADVDVSNIATVANGACSTTSWHTSTTVTCLTPLAYVDTTVSTLTVGAVVGTALALFSFDGPVVSAIALNAVRSSGASVTVAGLHFGRFDFTSSVSLVSGL